MIYPPSELPIPSIPFIPEELNPLLGLPFHLQILAALILMLLYITLLTTAILWWSWTVFERLMARRDPYFAYMRDKKRRKD